MEFILPNIDFAAHVALDIFLEFIEVMDAVVGNTDRSCFPGTLCFSESSPRTVSRLLATIRCVDENAGYGLAGFQLLGYVYIYCLSKWNARVMRHESYIEYIRPSSHRSK